MYTIHRMRRTQLYLDDDMARILSAVSRQKGTTVSGLVRQCIREKFARLAKTDKATLARELGGLWKDRKDIGSIDSHIRGLRKGTRRRRMTIG